jgi:hypothetical protein
MELKPSHKVSQKECSEANNLYWNDFDKFQALTDEQKEVVTVLVDAEMVFHRVKRWPITVQEVLDYREQRFGK